MGFERLAKSGDYQLISAHYALDCMENRQFTPRPVL
jgi:hypothetical protein